MARNVLTIRELGGEAGLLLIQQALGMPDAKMQSDFMEDKVAVIMFARRSLPERLCVTAAVRQMGGTTIFEGDPGGVWRQEIHDFQTHMLPILGYYIDCMYVYGFDIGEWGGNERPQRFPVINAGSPYAHPAHALADIACIMRLVKDIRKVRAAWIGEANGTLYSLMECLAWQPFELAVSMPPNGDSAALRQRARELDIPISFAASPADAVKGASFIFAGKRGELSEPDLSTWSISADLMARANDDAKLLLSASPVRAIPVDVSILSSKSSQLVRQAEYRLRVHKRILHWVFNAYA